MSKMRRSFEEWDVISRSVAGRQAVHDLVRSDASQALLVARSIPSGWYRVQSLSQIARYAPSRIAAEALDECGPSARACDDAYQHAAVLAWPVRAALETDNGGAAGALCKEAETRLPHIELFASRAEAITLLFQATAIGAVDLYRDLLDQLPDLCPPETH